MSKYKLLKYSNVEVSFSEVPDEISLCINITRCPINCIGCHSIYLQLDIGIPLTKNRLKTLIDKNDGITCISLMGGDLSPSYINLVAKWIKNNTSLKVAWYSGNNELSSDIELKWFDYIKLGPYIESLGPLNIKTTNQKFYKVEPIYSSFKEYTLRDITDVFWSNSNSIDLI